MDSHLYSSQGRPIPNQIRMSTNCPVGKAEHDEHCSCKPGTEPTGDFCTSCSAGFFKVSVGDVECKPCEGLHRTTAGGATSADMCLCASHFFDDDSSAHTCRPCTASMRCSTTPEMGSTLATLNLTLGYWRLTNMTGDIRHCADASYATRQHLCIG